MFSCGMTIPARISLWKSLVPYVMHTSKLFVYRSRPYNLLTLARLPASIASRRRDAEGLRRGARAASDDALPAL